MKQMTNKEIVSEELAEVKDYIISGIPGFNIKTFLSAMKTKYTTFEGLKRDNPKMPKVLLDSVEEHWELLIPLTFEDCIKEEKEEKRQVLFSALGPETIFKNASPILLDRQTIVKKRSCWDNADRELIEEYEDTYELYRIPQENLFPASTRSYGDIYAVRCICPSTKKEHWIMLAIRDVIGWRKELLVDAIGAVALTIRISEKFPKRIYRHGDVIIVQLWGDKRDTIHHFKPKPLTKEEYLSLMYSES